MAMQIDNYQPHSDQKFREMEHIEDAHGPSPGTNTPIPVKGEEDPEAHEDDNGARCRKLVRRVDMRLTLILAGLYITAFLDRSNLGNAYIAGLNADLHLSQGNRYSLITMIFFVGYILIDIPSAWLSKLVGVSIWIPSVALGWGILTLAQGFVKKWEDLLACRILLGFFEGSFTPAAIYVLSVWYTRYEVHKRYAAFYVLGIASSGLSGLLAYGIQKMDGDANIRGWRWIFILEGVVTCAAAIISYALLLDLPEKATKRNLLGIPPCFNRDEAAILMARIQQDRGLSDTEHFTIYGMLRELRDWKVWEFSILVMFNNVSLYAFSYFLPIILQEGLGYSSEKAQIMTFPPYAVAVVWVIFVAWICDKFHSRGPALVFNSSMYIVGIAMVGFAENVHVRYAGVFLGVVGICGNVPTNFGYQHNNTIGQAKRALCGAMMTIGGGFAGVIAGNVFRSQDAPEYKPGLIVAICFQAIAIIIPLKNFIIFARANRRADRGELILEGVEDFRYTL